MPRVCFQTLMGGCSALPMEIMPFLRTAVSENGSIQTNIMLSTGQSLNRLLLVHSLSHGMAMIGIGKVPKEPIGVLTLEKILQNYRTWSRKTELIGSGGRWVDRGVHLSSKHRMGSLIEQSCSGLDLSWCTFMVEAWNPRPPSHLILASNPIKLSKTINISVRRPDVALEMTKIDSTRSNL